MSMWYPNKRSDSDTRVAEFVAPQIEAGWNETRYHHARDFVPGNPKETWDFGPLLEFFGG